MDKFEKFLTSVTMCHTCGGYTAEDMRKAWEESARQERVKIVAMLRKWAKNNDSAIVGRCADRIEGPK